MMLIIGHRGAADLAPENTLQAMQAGMDAGADMLEFDVRLTSDRIAVVIHDATLLRTHHKTGTIGRLTLAELQAKTANQPLPTLEEVLDTFFGKIKLNIECKGKGSGIVAVTLASRYIAKKEDWENLLFSSFHTHELKAVRSFSIDAKLGLLHTHNPFNFVAHHRSLHLSAVGFYKLNVNPIAIAIAKQRGLLTYAYTVNRSALAKILKSEGIDGIVTNRPDVFR